MYEPYKTAESRVETHDSRFDHEFKTRKHFHKFMQEWAQKTNEAKPSAKCACLPQRPEAPAHRADCPIHSDLLDNLITEGEYSNE